MSRIHTFAEIVSTEAFYAFTSATLPDVGVSAEEFHSSLVALVDRRESVRSEVAAIATSGVAFHPMAHYGPKWYLPLSSERFVPPFRIPDDPSELIPARTAFHWCVMEGVRLAGLRWKAHDGRKTPSTEIVLSGRTRAAGRLSARRWAEAVQRGRNVRIRQFVADRSGNVHEVHNGLLDRLGSKRPSKNRSESWCPDLLGFGWDYPVRDEFGRDVPTRPADVELTDSGHVDRVREHSSWFVFTDTDFTEITRRAWSMARWRDTRRSYRIADNVADDVAQDACIRFARILQDAHDWPVLERDDQGCPVSWQYDRFRDEEAILSDMSDDSDESDESGNTDEEPGRYLTVTRVTFYNWSVKSALIRYNLGKPVNSDDDGHWAQGVQPRPEQVMSANTWTSHANLHNEQVWDEVWQDGAEYPVLRRTLAAQANRPKATKVQIQAEVADLTFNPPKMTQKWRLAAQGAAQDELARLGANLDKRRRETRSVFIRDESTDSGIN